MRKGGADSLAILLVIIIAIIVWAGIIILVVLAVIGIIAGITAIIKHYQEKKRLALEALNRYEKELQDLETEMAECKKLLKKDPSAIFIQSHLEILPHKIEIIKGEYATKHQRLPKIEKENILNQVETHKVFIKNYEKTIEINLPSDMHNAFINLCSAINIIMCSSQLWKVDKRKSSQYLHFWGSSMNRNKIYFKKEHFNCVVPSDGSDVFSIIIGSLKYYFYPEYIIESKSPISYKVYKYSDVSSVLKDVTVVENGGNVKGATNIGYTYLHTRVNGGPDLRYSYNPRYSINKYGYFRISNISNFCIDISNWNYARQLHTSLTNLKQASSKHTVNNNVPNNREAQNADNNLTFEKLINKEVHNIFQRAIETNGLQILVNRAFICILDDYHAFSQKTYLKNILKIVQDEAFWSDLCKESNVNKNYEAYVNEVSQKYLLKEEYVKELLYYIFEPGVQ